MQWHVLSWYVGSLSGMDVPEKQEQLRRFSMLWKKAHWNVTRTSMATRRWSKYLLSFVLLNSDLSSHERDESPFVFLSRKYPEEHESPDLRKLDPISDDAELLNFDLDKSLRCTQTVLIDVNNDVTYPD